MGVEEVVEALNPKLPLLLFPVVDDAAPNGVVIRLVNPGSSFFASLTEDSMAETEDVGVKDDPNLKMDAASIEEGAAEAEEAAPVVLGVMIVASVEKVFK